MGSDRPDQLDRIASTTEAVESLFSLFAAEEPLDDALLRVAQTAARAIPDADAISITVLADNKARTAACSEDRVMQLDLAQYWSNRGPCLAAAHARTAVRTTLDVDQESWPEFADAARQEGVRATLSVPLIIAPTEEHGEGELVGSLNIYSRTASAFDPLDEKIMQLFTVAAGAAIANARRWQGCRETVSQLERALTSRSEIDQAKGVIRALQGCSAEEAFEVLKARSQRANVRLHTVAVQLLDSLSDRAQPPL
ncbi:GAF and ANTAR domain-containing protein [Mycobacterium sp. CPCC 205372]|uniref:GAF and ANTAR domain-containing protein n=1 Tax=Mycobacterium hippophais TaxID=3016340 RepID=A0ABT4PPG9_9MYCO|nr:GAF and ANTAR domain-containing protein [Mycobacterium hippophais]MCZ8378454.1 GAF and ANTAR domain-containing protein [Mycobacterium hippophais]